VFVLKSDSYMMLSLIKDIAVYIQYICSTVYIQYCNICNVDRECFKRTLEGSILVFNILNDYKFILIFWPYYIKSTFAFSLRGQLKL